MADQRPKQGVTRRDLMRGAGLAAGAGLVLGRSSVARADEGEAPAIPEQAEGKLQIQLDVNGTAQTLTVETRTTLLEALRGPLGLTGAKPVCDRSQCGACTVHMNGNTVYACSVLAVEATGSKLVTVEGLGTPESMHAVQSAFVQEDGMQCGFCTPGMVMSCAFAVAKHGKDLTAEQTKAATVGNLCRCGTYPHVVKAALRAAKEA